MNCNQALKRLEALGTAQTRKTYGRHGVLGPMFGVKFGDLNKLVKQIKVDHDLALELWDSGNFDARLLATMIADPSKMTMKALTAWMKDVDGHALAGALSNVAQRSPVAQKIMHKWMASKKETVASTGWMMLAGITREFPDMFSKQEYRTYLRTIENEIYSSQNRVGYSMNLAMIGIGTYIDEKMALQVAARVGEVHVDHGDTSCKTPLAIDYIPKAAARHRAKLAKRRKS